uniref:tetratricopeptide repeat protein n=1 Tax=Paenibacillus sp. FSL H3-0457 TaxID=2921430 RepID=UPI00403F198D
MAYERAGRWAEAETAYTAALSMQPGSMAAWQRLLLLAAATGRPHAIASAAARISLPPAAWQALIPAALAAHRPEWLLRHAAALAGPLRAQPLAVGLALAQLGEDAAARAALQPWAAHAQHGPEAALALWALGHKQPGGRNARAAARHAAALPAAAHAAEALLLRGATARSSGLACSPPRAATPGGLTAPAPSGMLAAAQALMRRRRLGRMAAPAASPAALRRAGVACSASACGTLRVAARTRERPRRAACAMRHA